MTYYGGKDLARSFRTVRKNTLQIAHEISQDQYGFRATEGTRSVGETLAHIAGLSGWQQKVHGADRLTFMTFDDFGRYMAPVRAFEASLTDRDTIITALETEGRAFADWLESLSDETLAETIGFPPPLDPPAKTRFEMLLGVKEHEMHHRAQLMVVQRLLGQVPHLTRARQSR